MSKEINAFAIPRAVSDVYEICAKSGTYGLEDGKVATGLDLVGATLDKTKYAGILKGMPGPLQKSFEQAGYVVESSDGYKFLATSSVDVGFASEILYVLTFLAGGFIGERACTVIIVNQFDAPLVLERSTWDKGSSSGHEEGHPAIMNTDTKAFTHANEIPASSKDSRGMVRDGVGIFRFSRNTIGFFGCDGGLHFTCEDTALKSGATIAFQNSASNVAGVAVSVNSTDIDAFKEKYVDDWGPSSHGNSHTSTAQICGSIYPARGLWLNDGHDYDHMVITVVAGPR